MKHLIRLALVVGASVLAMPAMAQTVNQTINASITVITPITWTAVTNMDFGTISSPTVGATITLPSNSLVRTVAPAGAAMLVTGAPVAVLGAATLNSEGTYQVNLNVANIVNPPASLLVLSNITVSGGGNANVALAGATTTPAGSGSVATPLTFGGDMFVPAATAAGTYTGSFDVTAIYN